MKEESGSGWMPAPVRALRPKHWVKNVFVLAPLVFSLKLGDERAVLIGLVAFAIYCALSSAVYLINDIADREADRLHPIKRHRPVASGELGVPMASALALLLAMASLGFAWVLGPGFAGVASSYLFLNLAYSLALKRWAIVDVMLVAAGYLIRAWAGAVALGVQMSQWLTLCTGLIALFLGFVKRRQEIAGLAGSTDQRPSLRGYSLPFLDQMIAAVTASTVLAYALYAFSPEVAGKLGTPYMGLTIPFVLFGIFRYLYLVYQRGAGENPTSLLLSDAPLLVNVLLWGVVVLGILYWGQV